MNNDLLENKRDMFAIDIANLCGIGKNYLTNHKGIDFVHSDKKKTIDGNEHIFLRAERPSDNHMGFDFCEVILPENKIYLAFGFSDTELIFIEQFLSEKIAEIMQ